MLTFFLQIDMVEIKEAYKDCSSHDLAEDIKNRNKGNRRKILLGLIKGTAKNIYIKNIIITIKANVLFETR